MKLFSRIVSTALFVSCCGCGGTNPYKTTPVSGTVTCDGKPVPGAYIVFTPQKSEGRSDSSPGKPAMGLTDGGGKFVLSTYKSNDGALIGPHKVSISVDEDVHSPFRASTTQILTPYRGKTKDVEITRGMKPLELNWSE